MKDNNGKYKLSVEGRISTVEAHLKEIKDNHLPHLEKKVDRITWLLVVTLVAIIIELVIRFI